MGAYAADASAAIYIDAVTVDEGTVADISVEGISISRKRIDAGETTDVAVTVANYGMETANEFEVRLLNDGNTYAYKTVTALAPNSKQKVVFEIATAKSDASKSFAFTAEAEMTGDTNTYNNASGVVSVYVKGSSLPAARNLAGAKDGSDVVLTWEAPEKFEVNDPAEDDFEAYETFIIDGIGDWATYDGDGTPTVYFGGPEVPHAYEAKAWQVWAPEEAGFALDKFDVLTPHSGSKYLTCWAASNGIDATLPNDDWLISPEIAGGTDVTFWYRMPNAGSEPQLFEMLYSTTDREPESFTAFDSDGISFGTDWVYFEFTLPEDALYFAIRSCSTGSYTVALLDDITYTPLYGSTSELTLEGYNVYRDDELIADRVAESSYTDKDGNKEPHTYHVTAQWKEGESNYSNGVQVQTSGIEKELSSAIKVYSAKGQIIVKNANGKFINVFTPQGVRVFGDRVADSRINGAEIDSGWGDANCVVTPYVYFPDKFTKPYAGNSITKIYVGLAEDASNCYIYIKDKPETQENLYKQKVGELQSGWNEIILDTPFEIKDGDFASLTAGAYPSADLTDVGNDLDDYLSAPGWYGSKLYQAGGWLLVGYYGQSGELNSPAMDLTANEGKSTVALRIKSYPGKSVNYTISVTDLNTSKELTSFKGKATKTEEDVVLNVEGGTNLCLMTFSTTNERVYIDRISKDKIPQIRL